MHAKLGTRNSFVRRTHHMKTDDPNPSAPAVPPPVTPPIILLVEDDEMVGDATRDLLLRAGYRVLYCRTPEEALSKVANLECKLDLLLTDIVMPEMSGIQLSKLLKAQQPTLATLFMSGYTEVDALRGLETQAGNVIKKPFSGDALLSRIAEVLEAQNPTADNPSA